jgi:hypothetical protein
MRASGRCCYYAYATYTGQHSGLLLLTLRKAALTFLHCTLCSHSASAARSSCTVRCAATLRCSALSAPLQRFCLTAVSAAVQRN